MGRVIVGHLSPPEPMKTVQKIWRGEFVDLNTDRLGAPEPTLADTLQSTNKELRQIATIEKWTENGRWPTVIFTPAEVDAQGS